MVKKTPRLATRPSNHLHIKKKEVRGAQIRACLKLCKSCDGAFVWDESVSFSAWLEVFWDWPWCWRKTQKYLREKLCSVFKGQVNFKFLQYLWSLINNIGNDEEWNAICPYAMQFSQKFMDRLNSVLPARRSVQPVSPLRN